MEFVGLTALPYVEYLNGKNREGKDSTRVAWSYKADDIAGPGEAKKQNSSGPRAA